MSIRVFDRKLNKEFTEQVFGGFWIDLVYKQKILRSAFGKRVQKIGSQALGAFFSSKLSTPMIQDFCQKYELSLEDFQVPEHGFQSFNEFFIRAFLPGKRSFPTDLSELGSPAEARVHGFRLTDAKAPFPIKGNQCTLAEIIGEDFHRAALWTQAWVLRLCPVDYHAFHAPDSGTLGPRSWIGDHLDSVNPLALEVKPRLLLNNKRSFCVLQSENFGPLLLGEVGAFGVGAIVHTHSEASAQRGQRLGHFEFGGSTCILAATSQVVGDPDIFERSQRGIESYIRLGERIAVGAR